MSGTRILTNLLEDLVKPDDFLWCFNFDPDPGAENAARPHLIFWGPCVGPSGRGSNPMVPFLGSPPILELTFVVGLGWF